MTKQSANKTRTPGLNSQPTRPAPRVLTVSQQDPHPGLPVPAVNSSLLGLHSQVGPTTPSCSYSGDLADGTL